MSLPDDDLMPDPDDLSDLEGSDVMEAPDDDEMPDEAVGVKKGGDKVALHERLTAKLTDAQKRFREARKHEQDRRNQLNDSEYWFAVYFPTREMKDEFLRKTDILSMLDADKYVDGEELAKLIGVKLTKSEVFLPHLKVSPRWSALAQPLPEKKS